MPLLSDIQQDLLNDKALGPILLKLRFLASRLGSDILEEWVKFEIDGYPDEIEIPAYRKLNISYTANFLGIAGSQMRNAPVPKAVIEKHGGEAWLTISERQSVYALEDIIARTKGGMLTIDAANLILLLQGKMYPNMNCASVEGVVSVGEVVALLAAVRSRVLELTIQLEKSAPIAAMVSLGGEPTKQNEREAGTVTNITNQVIYGSYTSISNSNKGDGDQTTTVTDQSTNKSINIDASEEIISNVRDALNSGGIPSSDLPKLLEALDQLKNAKDKPSRLSAYNHFMSVCANHIGVIMPFVEPLQRMFLT